MEFPNGEMGKWFEAEHSIKHYQLESREITSEQPLEERLFLVRSDDDTIAVLRASLEPGSDEAVACIEEFAYDLSGHGRSRAQNAIIFACADWATGQGAKELLAPGSGREERFLFGGYGFRLIPGTATVATKLPFRHHVRERFTEKGTDLIVDPTAGTVKSRGGTTVVQLPRQFLN